MISLLREKSAPPMTLNSVPGYELKRKIGEGGFSEIYLGKAGLNNREVAVKVLHPRHQGNKTEYKRLLSEGAIGKRLDNHEHLCKTLDVGTEKGIPYCVFELLQGGTLRELLRDRGNLENFEVVELARAIGLAVRFLHTAGIYHRDLKPENVMCDGNGMIKVIDLGFAESHMAAKFSFFGRNLDGSPAYMAPEYIRSKKPSLASDLYAVGCTLYELATGKTPFTGSSDKELISKQANLSLKPTPPSQINKTITPETEKLIMNSLAKDINKRFKSVDEYLLELSRNPLSDGRKRGIGVPAEWNEAY